MTKLTRQKSTTNDHVFEEEQDGQGHLELRLRDLERRISKLESQCSEFSDCAMSTSSTIQTPTSPFMEWKQQLHFPDVVTRRGRRLIRRNHTIGGIGDYSRPHHVSFEDEEQRRKNDLVNNNDTQTRTTKKASLTKAPTTEEDVKTPTNDKAKKKANHYLSLPGSLMFRSKSVQDVSKASPAFNNVELKRPKSPFGSFRISSSKTSPTSPPTKRESLSSVSSFEAVNGGCCGGLNGLTSTSSSLKSGSLDILSRRRAGRGSKKQHNHHQSYWCVLTASNQFLAFSSSSTCLTSLAAASEAKFAWRIDRNSSADAVNADGKKMSGGKRSKFFRLTLLVASHLPCEDEDEEPRTTRTIRFQASSKDEAGAWLDVLTSAIERSKEDDDDDEDQEESEEKAATPTLSR